MTKKISSNKTSSNKTMSGFTLIELLVVITIIGILATIVVVNLNSARGRGQDTAIKEQMSQIRAQAALYYDDNFGYAVSVSEGEYSGACPTSSASPSTTLFDGVDFVRSIKALQRNAGELPNCYMEAASGTAPPQYWALTTKLRLGKTTNAKWCVDSVGNSQEVVSTYDPAANDFQCQ
jgi:prepilin-type N-terminal cleavage/methylation domain-containing protein